MKTNFLTVQNKKINGQFLQRLSGKYFAEDSRRAFYIKNVDEEIFALYFN